MADQIGAVWVRPNPQDPDDIRINVHAPDLSLPGRTRAADRGCGADPTPPRRAQVDLRQTLCKVCRHAICVGEAREWSHRPMGLVHDYCVGETT